MDLPMNDIESNNEGLWLAWKDIHVTSVDGKKVLLQDIAGEVKGKFLAIMGPSGSGKTTLMNVLARRTRNAAKVQEGEMRINGNLYSSSDLKRVSGYVMQDDLLFAHITVQETLQYAAELRLPSDMLPEERKRRVEEVIDQLGLYSCRNTVVGNAFVRGVSGGERKRLCVGIELLSNPKLLFLDEPTSGLDSATAFALCETLKQLAAARNCTVITTIHQPQSKIFALFDHLIVLNRGQILYHGPANQVLEFYEKAGFPCPPLTNPADHILDVITPTRSSEAPQAAENVQKLREYFKPLPITFKEEETRPITVDTKLVPWHRQFHVLLQRAFKEQYRNRKMIFTQFIQNIIMAILIGFVFYQIGDTQSSTVRRQPVMFFCAVNQGVFGALMLINSFPSEREIVLRERAAGSYKVSAYFMSKMLAEAAIQIVYPIVFSIIVYFIVGLHHSAGRFFIFLVFMILCNFAATSLALMISAICRTTNLSVNILPIALEIARLFGGFFLAPAALPHYFVWLDVLSYLKYTYVGVSLNELTGLQLRCLDSELVNGKCPLTTGDQTVAKLGFDAYSIGGCIGALILYIFLARVIAFIALKKIKW